MDLAAEKMERTAYPHYPQCRYPGAVDKKTQAPSMFYAGREKVMPKLSTKKRRLSTMKKVN